MKKIILLGITLVAGLVSCTKDYTDWATPQSNAANDPVQKLEMMVQPTVNSILFANDNGENIQLFTTNLTAEQASEYLLAVSGADGNTVVDMVADADGKVSVEELEDAVTLIYGKSPIERTLNITVSANVKVTTADGVINVNRVASPLLILGTI